MIEPDADRGAARMALATPENGAAPLAYADFAAAINSALRDFHRPDLLARSPLLGGVFDNVAATGPTELQALLSQTVAQLFGNARDDKVRRVFELTYFQPALKQEAVAERLALSFGTYRRHLTAGRERLARWLWERSRFVTAEAEASRGRATSLPGRPDHPPNRS